MSYLDRVFARKAEEVALAKRSISLMAIRAEAEQADPPRGFRNALAASPHPLALIAEVKKASPSQGVIRDDFDPGEIASTYEAVGADALSVLTEVEDFRGSLENLRIARQTTALPALRKDFLNDQYQLYEARAWGADAILLIVAALDDDQLRDLYALAHELKMDALVEVHTEPEAERALACGCDLIGVNNRQLVDLSTSLGPSETLIPKIAPYALAVSESALGSRADLDRVQAAGARAVLIGTSFVRSPDIGAKVREVMGW